MSRPCPECGVALEADEQFCGSCGCYLDWTDQPAAAPAAETPTPASGPPPARPPSGPVDRPQQPPAQQPAVVTPTRPPRRPSPVAAEALQPGDLARVQVLDSYAGNVDGSRVAIGEIEFLVRT